MQSGKTTKGKSSLSTHKERDDILFGNSSSFSASISRILTSWLSKVVEIWLDHCFRQYTEEYFHMKMDEKFNFIEDWKANHADKYATFISKARKMRHFFRIDENDIANRCEKLLTANGWTLYPHEKQMIIAQIVQLKKEIYT